MSPTDPEQPTLQHYREQLNLLNTQLLRLLELRGKVVLDVMELKRREGLPTHDPVREQAMLISLGGQSHGPYAPDQIELIFSAIFAASRSLADPANQHEAVQGDDVLTRCERALR